MKVKFTIKELLYSLCNFEVECESKEQLDKVLAEIGEDISADELQYKLEKRFGIENVSAEGIGDPNNIGTQNEYEFWEWVDNGETA